MDQFLRGGVFVSVYVFNILYLLFVKISDLYDASNIAWHMKKDLQGRIRCSQLSCFCKASLFRGLRNEMNELLDKETMMWFQRSHALCAIHGDKNYKYFHSRATQRFRKNKIDGIKNAWWMVFESKAGSNWDVEFFQQFIFFN